MPTGSRKVTKILGEEGEAKIHTDSAVASSENRRLIFEAAISAISAIFSVDMWKHAIFSHCVIELLQ
jgi:ketopantoate reductase